jgi:hypothetical protein
MGGLGRAIMLLGVMACTSQPGRDGPATPTTSDTVRYPGDADDPLDFPSESQTLPEAADHDHLFEAEPPSPTSLPASMT